MGIRKSLKKATKSLTDAVVDVFVPPAAVAGAGTVVDETQKELGQHQRTEDPPEIPLPPTRMPTSGDERAARRKSLASQKARRGRASTILTDDSLGA